MIKDLQETTKQITGRASLPVTQLNSMCRDRISGTTPRDGRDYEAVKYHGNWYLTGDYTITDPAAPWN